MAVFRTVSEILGVNNGVTLKSGLEVSRSLQMVQCKSLDTVFCLHSIVTMAVYCIISELK